MRHWVSSTRAHHSKKQRWAPLYLAGEALLTMVISNGKNYQCLNQVDQCQLTTNQIRAQTWEWELISK